MFLRIKGGLLYYIMLIASSLFLFSAWFTDKRMINYVVLALYAASQFILCLKQAVFVPVFVRGALLKSPLASDWPTTTILPMKTTWAKCFCGPGSIDYCTKTQLYWLIHLSVCYSDYVLSALPCCETRLLLVLYCLNRRTYVSLHVSPVVLCTVN